MGHLDAAAENLILNLWGDLGKLRLVAGKLSPDDMPSSDAGVVYGLMYDMARDPERVLNLGSIEQQARGVGVDDAFLSRMQFRSRREDVPQVLGYIDELKAGASVNRVADTGRWLELEAMREGVTAEQLVPEAIRRLSQADRESEGKLEPIGKYMDEARTRVREWRKGIVTGRSTGFKSLDSLIRLKPADLIILAARPSMGKTALSMQIAENVARQLQKEGDPGCVAIFSAEMAGVDLAVRMACAVAHVNADDAERGQIAEHEYDEVERTMARLESLPIRIDETSAPTTDQMYYRVATIHYEQPVRMVLFDFMELGGNTDATEELRISQISRQLKAIAKGYQIPVIALSQLNRAVESRASKLPALSDLRASGMIEQIADKVVFIMRPEYYISRGDSVQVSNPEDEEGVAYIIVAKNRNGPVGMRRMSFIEDYAKFGDLETRRIELNA